MKKSNSPTFAFETPSDSTFVTFRRRQKVYRTIDYACSFKKDLHVVLNKITSSAY